MMAFFIVFLSALIAGVEPFLPYGSALLAWASVLGVRRRDWTAFTALMVGGVVRDVLLVGTIGVSSVVCLVTWTLTGLGSARFDRPFLMSIAGSALGSVILSLIEKQPLWPGVIVTTVMTALCLALFDRCSSSGEIRLIHS